MKNNRTKTVAFNTANLQKLFIILFILSAILVISSSLHAQGNASARAVALGSAYTSLATGVDAARFNPANLGLKTHQQTSIEFAGVGANINNNSFTLDDYNQYNGTFLTTSDKENILSKIPNEGLKLSIEAEATAVGISSGSFAFTTSGFAVADVNLNKDILNLILNGNTFADTINITGSYSEGYAYASVGFSFGKALYKSGYRQLSIGSTFKYLKGLGIEKVIKLEGLAATYATGFEGNGSAIIHTSEGGSGYAVDFGAALQLNSNYTIGATINNFYSSINWNQNNEENGYIFNFDTMTVDNMGNDYITSDDYTIPISEFTTTLPSSLNVGFAKTSGKTLWALEWEQGFSSKTGVSTEPRLSAGVEFTQLGFLPLRLGYGTGGNKNSAISFGSGLYLSAFQVDFAIVTGNSFSGGSSKGANFALTTGLYF